MGHVRIGLSGWSYEEWAGEVYPEDLRSEDRLRWVAERVDAVEVNTTFYRLTSPAVVRRWVEAVPRSFRFAVKGSRYITHQKRLRDAEQGLANFFAAGLLELGGQLGPVLWQLPAGTSVDVDRLRAFLARLPSDTDEARRLARRHDDRVESVAYGPDTTHRLRHVLEVRDHALLTEAVARQCREHGVALATSHSSQWPWTEELTAGFAYLRLHGPKELYASAYDTEQLRWWAHRVQCWRSGGQPKDARRLTDLQPPPRAGRDVYVFFDNDNGGHAPRDAERLRGLVGAEV